MTHISPRAKLIVYLVSVGALFSGWFTRNYILENYGRVYRKAEKIAVRKYGDYKPPLESYEKESWFKDMDIRENKPSRKQLEKFIEDNQNYKLN